MQKHKKEIEKNRDKGAAKVWVSVQKFMEDGSFSTYKKAGTLCRLEMTGYSDERIAEYLNIKETTLRVHKRNISIELFNLFGEDFFDLLSDYDRNSKELILRTKIVCIKNDDINKLIPTEITSYIDSKAVGLKDVDYSLSSCDDEISFVLRHSVSKLKTEMDLLDMRKLKYVLGLLRSECGTVRDRFDIKSLFLELEESKIEND